VSAKKILCLVNSAAYSRTYFEQLRPFLQRHGYEVVFALDSHLSDVMYGDGKAIAGAWYFTDFVNQLRREGKSAAPAASLSWSSLLSDFDRFVTMEIPLPLRADSGVDYQQIPGLLADFFQRVFAAERPCAVLYEQVSNSFAIAAYRESLQAGIPFCSLCPSRLAGRIEVSMTGAFEDHVAVGAIRDRAEQGSISKESYDIARDYIRTIDQQTPDYMKARGAGQALAQLSLRKKYLRMDKLRGLVRSLRYNRNYPDDRRVSYQYGDPVSVSYALVKRAFWRRMRSRAVSRLYQNQALDEPFLLYPLHSHPEASTSVLAPDFIDELSVIRSIAFRLPVNVRLYVKEHPSAVASQPLSFYRQLAALPNVRLLAAHLPAKELIRKSRGVVCITSTLGFEAAVLNKPVIALGDILYGYFPNVRMVRDYSAFDSALDWVLNYQPVPAHDLLVATAAYVEFGAPGSFDFYASLGDAAALQSVADAVAVRLDAWHKQRT
jgi:hypothetical protein